MDLAVDEPSMACRSANFAGLRGHQESEARQRILTALAELSAPHWSEVQVPFVASNHAFVVAVEELLWRAQDQQERIALLADGLDRIHVDVLSALGEAWNRFQEASENERSVVLLLAGRLSDTGFSEIPRVELPDYAQQEALKLISPSLGEGLDEQTRMALDFSGGVPTFVGALSEGVRRLGGLPYSATGLIRLMGSVEGEVRQVLDLLAADPRLADRLECLSTTESAVYESDLDQRLIAAGVVREIRAKPGERRVALRATLLAALLG